MAARAGVHLLCEDGADRLLAHRGHGCDGDARSAQGGRAALFPGLSVADDEVPKVVKLIIDANRTGAPGDGKIFVLPVYETCCIRTGQRTSDDL